MNDELDEELAGIGGFYIELDDKKLQNLAIRVDKILKEEMQKAGVECGFFEARIYNIRTVGVQGDNRTYSHPAEITMREPRYSDGRTLNENDFYDFLNTLSTRITNEIKEVNRVLYVTATRDDRDRLYG